MPTMTMMRWLLAIALIAISAFLSVMNWLILYHYLRFRQKGTVVPILGGVAGVMGLLMVPGSLERKWIYALPIIWDWGTLVFIYSFMFYIPYQTFKKSRS